jgi:choline dehydrogenase-like flavoprotein
MGDDPATSVVDRDLRAHEVDNLFVVGSAVFPTAGPLNPSLTIAALALRAAGAIQEAPGGRARPGRAPA